MLLLFSTAAFSQTKESPAPPPIPEIKVEKPIELAKEYGLEKPPTPPIPPSPPDASDIKGHPWTRNGQTVWVVKPPKPMQPPTPPKLPVLPPPPPQLNEH